MVKVKLIRSRRYSQPCILGRTGAILLSIFLTGFILLINYLLLVSDFWKRSEFERSPHFESQRHEISVEEITVKDIRNLWFMKNGFLYPKPSKKPARLLPEQASGDRLLEQLMHHPASVNSKTPDKIIYPHSYNRWYEAIEGKKHFERCPVSQCVVQIEGMYSPKIHRDAVIFGQMLPMKGDKPPGEFWIGYHLESPVFSSSLKDSDPLNWTANVRSDSDIVSPYAKWIYYDPDVRQLPQSRNYALNKTKLVAWIVSNCNNVKNNRLEYAKELSKYIPVDIYGKCGTLKCPRSNDTECTRMLRRDYKFYLAFENSNCREYITEKFFLKGLQNDVVPIAMGAFPEDYMRMAPENSYILVDDFAGPQELAEYLYKVDRNDTLYNSYFEWRGTGEFIGTYFWCRLCAMLHSNLPPKYYENYAAWWISPEACRNY